MVMGDFVRENSDVNVRGKALPPCFATSTNKPLNHNSLTSRAAVRTSTEYTESTSATQNGSNRAV